MAANYTERRHGVLFHVYETSIQVEWPAGSTFVSYGRPVTERDITILCRVIRCGEELAIERIQQRQKALDASFVPKFT